MPESILISDLQAISVMLAPLATTDPIAIRRKALLSVQIKVLEMLLAAKSRPA